MSSHWLYKMKISKRTRKKKESQQHAPSPGLQDKSVCYNRFISWGLVIAAIVFIAAIRIRLLSIPLERDEGEFAYMGQLMLQGIPPYALAANMKLPGTYAAYALIMALFGQTIEGIHLGFLLVNVSTMILLFLLTRRLFDDYTGVVACATFGILSLNPSLYGTSAHASHFVLLPALGGIILLLKALQHNKWFTFFLSGILLGFSFIIKQPGLFFSVFALFYLIGSHIKKAHTHVRSFFIRMALFASGVIIPYIATCITLYALGVFKKFWFWTVLYAYQYGTLSSFSEGIRLFLSRMSKIIGDFYLLWVLAAVGLLVVILDKELRSRAAFVFGFFLFSFLALCPGLYFREHYFVFIVPTIAICSGIAVTYFRKHAAHWPALRLVPGLLFLLCFFHGVFLQRSFFFTLSPEMACRQMYFPNPFPESIEIAHYIKTHSLPDSTIAVLGSEPQIYFYAHRHSATSYLYTYSLMENQKYADIMQKEMIAEIENTQPQYIIFVNITKSWLRTTDSNMRLLSDWLMNYQKQYVLAGIVDIVSRSKTEYRWESEAQGYKPGPAYVIVLKRI